MEFLDVIADVFGCKQFVDEDLLTLISRFALNGVFAAGVIIGVYNRRYKSRDFIFTCFLFNAVTFIICALLRKVPMDMGFALGLFAVFGILRYRTEGIKTSDLTYLFILIAIGIVNSVANKKVSLSELLFANVVIFGLTYILELRSAVARVGQTPMLYDNLPLLQPGKEADLLADVRSRTGLDAIRVDVSRYDMLKDAAEVTVIYRKSETV